MIVHNVSLSRCVCARGFQKLSSNNYKECMPSDNPDYFDGSVRPSGNPGEEKDISGGKAL